MSVVAKRSPILATAEHSYKQLPRTITESLSMTVFGSEFQMAGAEQRKALFANVVLGDD